jgi:hypothetical protein
MTDQWVRSPDQQALTEAQAIVEAQPRGDIVVRHYPGAPAAAVNDFKADVARMIPAGWHPVSVVYASVPLDRATILSLGVLASARTPGGSLVATYRYQRPESTPGPIPPG